MPRMSMDLQIVRADARHLPLANGTVQCIVTSPPYWGLRKYQGMQDLIWPSETWRGGFGLEPTIPMYIEHTLVILREMRRVLRSDGVLFWNIGDSYYSGNKSDSIHGRLGLRSKLQRNNMASDFAGAPHRQPQPGLKPKDLCLMPSRVALAAQEDGWWVRSMIIWAKPNAMPESVSDRPTNAYDHILMLTKSEHYYWDAKAVMSPAKESTMARLCQPNLENQHGSERAYGGEKANGPMKPVLSRSVNPKALVNAPNCKQNASFTAAIRGFVPEVNLRNVWTFPVRGYRGAHFATFPEELPRRCILAASRPGDLVLDPFADSGTTGRVAIELNRRCVCADIAYQEQAARRTRNVQRSLLESAAMA